MNTDINILPSEEEKRLISKHLADDVKSLAFAIKEGPGIRRTYVLQQIAGYQAVRKKIPSWADVEGVVFPVHLSVEQCSSEQTALYKAELVARLAEKDGLHIDMTGGFGVDFSFIARGFKEAVYIERNEELAAVVDHNLPLLGLNNATAFCGDGVEYIQNLSGEAASIFLDPARRDQNGSKTVHLADCTPDLIVLQDLLLSKSKLVVAKLSPMLDLSECLSQLHNVSEVHVVSVDNECKELLVVMQRGWSDEPRIFTINNNQRFDFLRSEEQQNSCPIACEVGNFIYEPNSSLLKSGAFKCLATRLGLKKFHPSSHLYTSEQLVNEFPGRSFEVLSVGALGKNSLPETMAGLKKANIAVRNFPQKVDDIRKKLKMNDGGDDYVFATTISPEKKILIHCRKP